MFSLPSKNPVRLIATVFSVGVALGSGISYGALKVDKQQAYNLSCSLAEVKNVSRVDYERLQLNMSQADVESILDPGIETSRSENTVRMIWENCDGSRILVTLENGVLKHKEQSGLQ